MTDLALVPGTCAQLFRQETLDRLGAWLAEQPGRTWDLWTSRTGSYRAQVEQRSALGYEGDTNDAFGSGATPDDAIDQALRKFGYLDGRVEVRT